MSTWRTVVAVICPDPVTKLDVEWQGPIRVVGNLKWVCPEVCSSWICCILMEKWWKTCDMWLITSSNSPFCRQPYFYLWGWDCKPPQSKGWMTCVHSHHRPVLSCAALEWRQQVAEMCLGAALTWFPPKTPARSRLVSSKDFSRLSNLSIVIIC